MAWGWDGATKRVAIPLREEEEERERGRTGKEEDQTAISKQTAMTCISCTCYNRLLLFVLVTW